MRQRAGRLVGAFWGWRDRGRLDRRGPARPAVAAGTVLEAGDAAGRPRTCAGEPRAFFVAVYDADGAEIERHPASRPIELRVPDEPFEARNWTRLTR